MVIFHSFLFVYQRVKHISLWRCPQFGSLREHPPWIPSGKHTKNYGKSPFLMGKLTINMAIFNSYVKLPLGSELDEFPLKIPRRVSSDTKIPAYAGLPKGSCRISSRQELVGWWLEPWNFEWLSRNSWEFHHPNWLSLTNSIIFQRGRASSTTNQRMLPSSCHVCFRFQVRLFMWDLWMLFTAILAAKLQQIQYKAVGPCKLLRGNLSDSTTLPRKSC